MRVCCLVAHPLGCILKKREVLIRSTEIESRLRRKHLGLRRCLSWSLPRASFVTHMLFCMMSRTYMLSQSVSPATELRMNEKKLAQGPVKNPAVSYKKYKVVSKKIWEKKQTFIGDSRDESFGESGTSETRNDRLSALISMFFCAGGAEQYSSQRRTHQGRRSHSTGAYFHLSDQT